MIAIQKVEAHQISIMEEMKWESNMKRLIPLSRWALSLFKKKTHFTFKAGSPVIPVMSFFQSGEKRQEKCR